ncbi:response regulator transcription factor [Stakelama marina]|uniref:response regulator transcription factor n=1 Tax=Stakelama marina TaxID=2826939 RepID=UPI0024C3882A|nr:LuxR C-terminal-related transcriptional regulator [Stakelama marina]
MAATDIASQTGIEPQIDGPSGRPRVRDRKASRLVHVVIDDAALMSRAVGKLAASGFKVQRWRSAEAMLRVVRSVAPGCLLLDGRAPGHEGLAVQQQLIEWGLMPPIVMLTSQGDVQSAVQAVKSGLVEILEEPFELAALKEAVDRAFAAMDILVDLERDRIEAQRLLGRLTARELDVLQGLTDGLPNKSIAYDLGISPRTVEVYRANIMEKLEARSLSAVLRVAFAARLQ